jgi:predicted phage tail component-like protein
MSYIEIFGTLFDASFNGTNLSAKSYYIYDIKKPHLPKQKVDSIDIPGKSGSVISSKKFTENKITLFGFMECSTYDDLTTKLEDLAAFLYSDTDKQLISSKQADRYWNCQYIDYDIIEQRDDYALVNLTFSCVEDPFGYDTTATTDSQTITVKDTTYNVTNAGNYYAFPVFTITFLQAQTHIYVENNNIVDNRFDISKAFTTNDVLEVDCKNGTIKLNGSNSPAGFGDGGSGLAEWLMLAVGVNELCVGSDDASINATVALSFNKPYLY